MRQLINFLRETQCWLRVYPFMPDNTIVVVIFGQGVCETSFTLRYRIVEDNIILNLDNQIQAFLKNETPESLDNIYKHNHHFIDYCVDNSWLIREEKISHKYNESCE